MTLRYANGQPVTTRARHTIGQPVKFVEPPACPSVDASMLKPGDLLLTHGHQWYSGAIQDIQPYFASHAMGVLRGPDGKLYGGSMEPPVGLIVSLADLLAADVPVWVCRTTVVLSPVQEEKLWAFWNEKVRGKPYDYLLLPILAPWCLWQRLATLIRLPQQWRGIEPVVFGKVCSVAVAQGWKAAGLAPVAVNGASPYACSQERFVGPVEQVQL